MRDEKLIKFRFDLMRLGILEDHFIATAKNDGLIPRSVCSVHEINREDYDRLIEWAAKDIQGEPQDPDPF